MDPYCERRVDGVRCTKNATKIIEIDDWNEKGITVQVCDEHAQGHTVVREN